MRGATQTGNVDRVRTSGSLVGVKVSTMVWNARGVRSKPALGGIFPILITHHPTEPQQQQQYYAVKTIYIN